MPVDPNHHYLPALDPDTANVPMPPTAAHWAAQPAGLLQAVGNGIAVDDSAAARGVSSVPDAWARAVLFQSALRPSHPLHAQAVADWRGLLSLLALREVYGYDVEVVPVSLAGGGKLPAALRTLAPPPVELEPGTPYAWTDVLLVRLEGVPIGAFSPGSLVYTATGYRDRLRAHYEPADGPARKRPDCLAPDYALVAPTKASDEHSAHFVAEYVYDLYTACRAMLSGAPEAQRISELLETWLYELRNAFGYNPQDRVNAPEVKLAAQLPTRKAAADWPEMADYGVYRATLLPLVPDEVRDEDPNAVLRKSSIFLRHTRNHTDLSGVVVVHKDTLTKSARVWGLRRLSSLGETVQDALDTHFDAPRGTAIGSEDLARLDAAWVRPERYFLTDVLLAPREGTKALADGEYGPSSPNGTTGEFVLPFRREVLELFGPEAVQTVLRPRFEHQRDGGVKFSFDLPVGDHPDLAPADGSPSGPAAPGGFGDAWGDGGATARTEPGITVERVYRVKREGDPDDGSGAIQAVDLPVLDLFPDYLGPSWRRYWLFQSDADRFDCRPYAHGAAAEARDRRDAVDGLERTARVTEVHGDDPFPDAVEVRAANGTPGGLVLTKRPLWDEAGVSGEWVVGIDFGTSNTNVSKRDGTNPVDGWTADFPALLRPLTTDPQGRRDALLQAFFVPNRAVAFPVPTLLDIRSPNPEDGRALLDYFALFPDGYTWAPRIRTDIKWDSEGSRVTEFYLESVLLLVLMEVTRNRVKAVDLRCTYPKAFSPAEVEVLRGEWERTLQALTTPGSSEAAVGAVPNQTVSVSEPAHHSEGRMAGVFFSSDSAIEDATQRAKRAKAVCVDVGGGTTDLALLYEGDIVYDSSIRIAGRDIADYIALRPKLREALLSDEAEAALRDIQTDRKLFGARLNGILRREKDRIPDQLNRQANNPDVVRLRQLIALKFGALAFHVGTVLGAAERHAIAPGLADELKSGGISVHWGGNGAQLATWIDYGKYRPDGLAAKILNRLLYFALADAEAVPNGAMLLQAQSPNHKFEAVGGVAVFEGGRGNGAAAGVPDFLDPSELGGNAQRRSIDGVICGETITLTDGSTVGFLDPITKDTLFDDGALRFAHSSSDRLRRFIDLFNEAGKKFGLVTADTEIPHDDATVRAVTDKARDRYVQMLDVKESQRAVEPVFITEVRELMQHVASSTR